MGKPPREFWLNPKIIERFWERVDKRGPDECWPWTHNTNKAGYGQLHICEAGDRLALLAHRIAYMVAYGQIPAGKLVLHSCDNPPCCNARHLRAGTHKDNTDDKMARGRHRSAMAGRQGQAHPRTLYGPDIQARALDLHSQDWKRTEIARELGCHRVSVSRWIEEAELATGIRREPSQTLKRSRPAG